MGMPVVLSAAGDVPHIKPSDAIAIVTGVTYLGFLMAPPFFGFMGDALGAIRWSLLLCAGFIFVIVVLPGAPPPNTRCHAYDGKGQREEEVVTESGVVLSDRITMSPLHGDEDSGGDDNSSGDADEWL